MTQARQERAGRAHPAAEDLVELMRGELAPKRVAPIVRHLLAGCAHCTAITRKLWSFGEEARHLEGWVRPFPPARRVEVWL